MIIHGYADVVLGLQYGDEGKGKIAASIAKQIDYDLVARYNGGPNAGHSVHLDEFRHLKLHQIPSGIAFKRNCYIGPGCLIDFTQLENEACHVYETMGIDTYEFLKISPQAIVIESNHIQKDKEHHAVTQGSTSKGIAPAYSNFYNRTATLARDFSWPNSMGVDCISNIQSTETILLEGAQGWYLNPYQGTYPYTTSSSCHPGYAASSFGFPLKSIRNVIGVAKCYETRSGTDPNFAKVLNEHNSFTTVEDHPEIYKTIQKVGSEYGVTTGRKRTIRFLDLNRLINAINGSGTNMLVLQKWDILQEAQSFDLEPFKFYYNANLIEHDSLNTMYKDVATIIKGNCPGLNTILYSAELSCSIDWKEYL